jgi:hypothetical protein
MPKWPNSQDDIGSTSHGEDASDEGRFLFAADNSSLPTEDQLCSS